MMPNPYQNFRNEPLTLGDYLSIDRTILANERTALAYSRTFLAMLVIGGTCFKFFDTWPMWVLGSVFIAGSFVVAGIGLARYRRTQRNLAAALEERTGKAAHPRKPEAANAEKQVPVDPV